MFVSFVLFVVPSEMEKAPRSQTSATVTIRSVRYINAAPDSQGLASSTSRLNSGAITAYNNRHAS